MLSNLLKEFEGCLLTLMYRNGCMAYFISKSSPLGLAETDEYLQTEHNRLSKLLKFLDLCLFYLTKKLCQRSVLFWNGGQGDKGLLATRLATGL